MNQPARFAAVFAATLVPGIALAQHFGASPMAATPPPAMPVTPPPVEPMTWAAVALQTTASAAAATPAANSTGDCPTPAAPLDPEVVAARAFQEVRVAGRDLKDSVGRVLGGLDWREKLEDARATAAATGQPILWIQSLGDLDGFA